MNAIEIRNLTFSYNDSEIIFENFNLNLKKGCYSTIIGHNGSGKSTLAKLLIGLLESSKGDIMIEGTILSPKTLSSIRDKVGIVFQNPDNQFIGATVRDDIAFGLENRCIESNKMDAIINEYASKVKMESFLEHEPSRLSGGQKQRVAIAGILALQPSILILDEATSMLDPIGKAEVLETIRSLKSSDMTIISITHDIEEASLADEVIVLNRGRVIKQGTPDTVFTDVEEFRKINLNVPFALQLSKLLNITGIVNESELINRLWELKLKI